MKYGSIALIILFFVGLGFYVFNRLGGFNPIELNVQQIPEISLIGIHYKGTPDNEQLITSFRRIENIQEKNPQAVLYTIYYIEPAGKRDTMEVFMGVESSYVQEREGFVERTIPAGKAIMAIIKRDPLVMPSPKSIKGEIESYALSNGLSKPTFFIDRIVRTSEVQVIAPIQ